CADVDIRGELRPQDGHLDGEPDCDAGSFELTHPDSAIHWVNIAEDLPDAGPGDGLCDADESTEGPQCSLRAAVMEANARPGLDAIRFSTDLPESIELALEDEAGPGAAGGDLDVTDSVLIDASDWAKELPTLAIKQQAEGERLF